MLALISSILVQKNEPMFRQMQKTKQRKLHQRDSEFNLKKTIGF